MIRIAGYFYIAMAGSAMAINWVRGVPLMPLEWTDRLPPALLAALAFAALTVGFSRYVEDRFSWARELHAFFRQKLGPLDTKEVLTLALASGLAEEMLFRGMLQPAFCAMLGSDFAGWFITTTAFAILHVARKELWPWTLFAFVIGGLLGGLQLYSGNVLAPALLHVVVNTLNLKRIARPAGAA